MHEFSSISVSSYEAGTLADRLTEQSREGWSVVAIVPTGSTVTAYLSRESAAGAHVAPAAGPEAAAVSTNPTPEVIETPPESEPPEHPTPEPADAESDAQPVEEVGGWAASTTDAAAAAAAPGMANVAGAADTAAGMAGTAAGGATAAGTAIAGAAAAGGAPAGWYADPSARYELRYWDGSQWTEHVSRAGQQYTDPPIA